MSELITPKVDNGVTAESLLHLTQEDLLLVIQQACDNGVDDAVLEEIALAFVSHLSPQELLADKPLSVLPSRQGLRPSRTLIQLSKDVEEYRRSYERSGVVRGMHLGLYMSRLYHGFLAYGKALAQFLLSECPSECKTIRKAFAGINSPTFPLPPNAHSPKGDTQITFKHTPLGNMLKSDLDAIATTLRSLVQALAGDSHAATRLMKEHPIECQLICNFLDPNSTAVSLSEASLPAVPSAQSSKPSTKKGSTSGPRASSHRDGFPNSPSAVAFGKRLTKAREEKGWTITELAKRVGLVRPSISRYENGHVDPSTEIVVRLARVLEVEPNRLLGDL